jgi:redox-sensitive bicupin YhaK (pirin superfamily)
MRIPASRSWNDGKQLTHRSAPGHTQWLRVIDGEVSAAGETLSAGDGVAVESADRAVQLGASPRAPRVRAASRSQVGGTTKNVYD